MVCIHCLSNCPPSFLSQIRLEALKTINRSYSGPKRPMPFSLETLTRILAFSDIEEVCDLGQKPPPRIVLYVGLKINLSPSLSCLSWGGRVLRRSWSCRDGRNGGTGKKFSSPSSGHPSSHAELRPGLLQEYAFLRRGTVSYVTLLRVRSLIDNKYYVTETGNSNLTNETMRVETISIVNCQCLVIVYTTVYAV